MQNLLEKICSRCGTAKPLSLFPRRAMSLDGRAAACKTCINEAKQISHWVRPGEREATKLRVVANKRARFERDPAYKRAFNLWGSTKKRTSIPPWAKIADFVPICKAVLEAGPEYELDHIVPLKHPLVSGLHVPWNLQILTKAQNSAKANSFDD